MSEKKHNLFIIAYPGKDTADEVYKAVRHLEKEHKIDIKTAATVQRKSNGKLKLKHKRRVTVWKGVFGGGALGLLLAGTGVGLLAGAVVGALVGSSRSGQRRDVKKFLDDKLGPDDSALVMSVDQADWAVINDGLQPYGGDALLMELTREAAQQISDVAHQDEVVEAVEEEMEVVHEAGPAIEAEPEAAAEVEAAEEAELPAPPAPEDMAKFRQHTDFIKGIGPIYSAALLDIGIDTPKALLERGGTRKGRAEIAEQTGISHKLIMTWVNQADLYRIKGVGAQYGRLLEAVGVDTVPELAQRNPENLHQAIVEANGKRRLVKEVPAQNLVTDWVKQANDLPRVVTY